MGGLHIAEERQVAGRLAAALYLTGAVTGTALLVMPGVHVKSAALLLSIAAVGALWGLAALTVVPWKTAPPIVSHVSSGLGLPITAVVVANTGGATSPARFYLLFIVFYCSYFYGRREALMYLAACVAVHSLPLAYAPGVASQGFLAELLVIVPTYVVLGGLILSAKALLVRLRDESQALAVTDALTGVANRRAFETAVARIVPGTRHADSTGLLLVDLDDFKSANTLFGHTGGDRVLRRAAAALREAARGNDMVARVGGDEFAILAAGVDAEGMTELADRVLDAIGRTDAKLALPGFHLSASAGWALCPAHARDGDELIERADSALAAAKVAGKDRWVSAAPAPLAAIG